jgi:hypothetical protein
MMEAMLHLTNTELRELMEVTTDQTDGAPKLGPQNLMASCGEACQE